jgi:translocation and assembly module TamB
MDSQLMVIRGEIGVPMADIEISKLPNPSFTQSNDVIVIGREAPPATKSIKQDIAITLKIDDKVVIKAAGLATKLRGALQYTSPPNKPAQLQGKLDLVDGSLTSQNGDLSIKRGSLLFTGSTDNPNVDIVAVRQIESPAIEVGLHITGTVKDLRTAIISTPAIDQTRALSYLVFGRDITQDDQGDNNSNAQLMSAAISLGIGQSSNLVQNLKRSIGLDELAAVANDSGTASLVAGKQINNKLYARYRYDMAEALGVLLLRYRLSQRWTLEAESGADNSIDVLYRLGD